jgi:hypothetical protein
LDLWLAIIRFSCSDGSTEEYYYRDGVERREDHYYAEANPLPATLRLLDYQRGNGHGVARRRLGNHRVPERVPSFGIDRAIRWASTAAMYSVSPRIAKPRLMRPQHNLASDTGVYL